MCDYPFIFSHQAAARRWFQVKNSKTRLYIKYISNDRQAVARDIKLLVRLPLQERIDRFTRDAPLRADLAAFERAGI